MVDDPRRSAGLPGAADRLRCSRRGACSRSARRRARSEARTTARRRTYLVNLVLTVGIDPRSPNTILSLVILVTCPSRTNSLMFWTASRSALVMVAHLNSFGSSASGSSCILMRMPLSSSRRKMAPVSSSSPSTLAISIMKSCAEDGPNHFLSYHQSSRLTTHLREEERGQK